MTLHISHQCFLFLLQLKEFEIQNRQTCRSDPTEWTDASSPNANESFNFNVSVWEPRLRALQSWESLLSSTRVVDNTLYNSLLAAALSMFQQWTWAPLNAQQPNCRALGGLPFISVKALNPHCAMVCGWILHRALLCRLRLFDTVVGWWGAQGQGTFFQIVVEKHALLHMFNFYFLCFLRSLFLIWRVVPFYTEFIVV